MSNNTICHIEITSGNAKAVAEFYEKLFGWKLNTDMGDEYIFFQPESGPGGAVSKGDFTPGTGVTVYIEVDDIEAYLSKANELGGKTTTAKTEIPHVGWYGKFTDPSGNQLGLFTPNAG